MFATNPLRRSLLIGLVAMLGACSAPKDQGAAIEIRNAWSPTAPPGAAVVAVYAEVIAAQPDTLLSVSSTAAASAELHSTLEEDGMMRMRPVDRIELQAGETVHLQPGGLHLMLMGVHEPLPADARIPLVFHFATAGEVAATATVRSAAATDHTGH